MNPAISFDDRINASLGRLSPAAQRAAYYFRDNREEVLIASASMIAQQAGTSDATVIRTARALGFSGMEELRRSLARELTENLSPAGRLAGTLNEIGDDLDTAFNATLDIHLKALENLRRDVSSEQFRAAVTRIGDARRVFIFGMGPSSAIATYFETQLVRFGIDAYSLTQSGLLLADGLQKLRNGDLLIIFAYSRVYRELEALIREADRHRVARILVTDSLGERLRTRVDLVLSVARGRAGMLSMHTATLGLVESLLVGIATTRPEQTLSSLQRLNQARAELAGKAMQLPGR
jgi:DNA-binding MurR/RpiR family transcriptional regulator